MFYRDTLEELLRIRPPAEQDEPITLIATAAAEEAADPQPGGTSGDRGSI